MKHLFITLLALESTLLALNEWDVSNEEQRPACKKDPYALRWDGKPRSEKGKEVIYETDNEKLEVEVHRAEFTHRFTKEERFSDDKTEKEKKDDKKDSDYFEIHWHRTTP